MTRGNNEQKKDADDHQRGAMSSHPPDLNSAQVSNAKKLEKDVESDHSQPIEQHRSSKRPRRSSRNSR